MERTRTCLGSAFSKVRQFGFGTWKVRSLGPFEMFGGSKFGIFGFVPSLVLWTTTNRVFSLAAIRENNERIMFSKGQQLPKKILSGCG